jgi:hypothetical protein
MYEFPFDLAIDEISDMRYSIYFFHLAKVPERIRSFDV